ncbi:MAG: AAA family ATPase [Fusobacterium perfoetens]|uniref:AAA family ATPase n=1 Tax=Fusobacterium perfoetens TaxID=852 RepID=UPI0023F250A4|nr:AAA family ATPase [Fusobacterium perfoetens]MCI6152432.1 AAA family ATPase [Fusobacterium perfoetens]MDY3237031.1 AAA family ATPase [Fusobacterium perfoetens]
MKPILLEIEGLQSFREKQKINFEKLGEAGIFGIFGETGSGKSTILDGIILALYGEVPKSSTFANNQGGIRNLLNTSSDKMEIYFKFALGEDIFEISRKYYLGKTKGELDLKTKEIILKKNGEIIAEKANAFKEKIGEEFGLGLEDFTRTVVLPQGQFSEFLKLKGEGKRKLLERIFNMEKYGKALQEKANEEKKFWAKEIEKYENQKLGFGETSKEEIENLEIKQNQEKELLKDKENEKENFLKDYKEKEELKNLLEKNKNLKNEKAFLDLKKDEIELEKKSLKRSQEAYEIIEHIEIFENIKNKIEINNKKLEKILDEKAHFEDRIKSINTDIENDSIKLDNIIKEKESIDYNKDEEIKLGRIIFSKKNLIEKENDKLNKLKDLEIIEKEIKSINLELENNKNKALEIEKEKLEIPKIDESILEKILDEKKEFKNIIDKYRENSKKKENYIKEKDELLEKEYLISTKKNQIIEKIEKLEKIKIENIALQLAINLKEGEPCPVCGSTSHPHLIFETDNYNGDINKDLKNFNKEREEYINEEGKIKGKIDTITRNIEELTIYFKEKLVDENLVLELENKIQELDNIYLKEKQKIDEINNKKLSIEKEEILINNTVKNLEDKNLEKEKNLKKIKNEIDSLEKKIEDIKNSIFLEGEVYIDNSIENLEIRKKILEENGKKIDDLLKIEKTFEKNITFLKSNLEKLKKEFDEVLLDEKAITTENSIFNKDKIEKGNIINSLSDKYNFKNNEEVKESFLGKAKEESLKEEIEEYSNNYQRIITLLLENETLIKGRDLSEEEWEKLKLKESEIEATLNNLIVSISSLERDIKEKKLLLEQLEKIGKEIFKAQKNFDIAEDLYKKLKSGDFIKFLTTKRLKTIVANASERLNRISNGRYQLESNKECDFFVVDIFNNGDRRRTGTLSGGETFIVSLCLALALSKQLQLKGRVPLEFFFLDEGFGSLDSKLLDKVIDSIENIKNEEKLTIGVISHLEDLKVRIIKRLEVEKATSERGSRIKLI